MKIEVEGLKKFYGKGDLRAQILSDVSFTIDAGEFVAIMGTSGSGKTTLLNVMGGLDSGFIGDVRVGPNALRSLDERSLAGLRNTSFGFVFQQFHLLDHLSSLENVALPDFFDAGHRTKEAARARAKELLEKVGLGHKLSAKPTELSGGQKQRVAIARALFNDPEIIFCDEPTGSLDRNTGLQIMELFRELNEDRGITLIMVTHEEHIAQMARRILRLEDGVLVGDDINAPVHPRLTTMSADESQGEQE